jgi:cytosine/adenosine deaminase-related metal-dependent hydrolase
MFETEFNRRAMLAATTVLTAASMLPRGAMAQNAPAAPPRGEFVVRGAYVLSMDAAVGDLPRGDVHVRDGAIVAVAANVDAPSAVVMDGTGMICMPGLIDTHWHHWTNILRVFMRWDDPKATYFPVTARYGTHYTPEDVYRSVRIGLAEALAAGITTTQNWSHNVRSPKHADAEMSAMRDVGIRGRFAYGSSQGQSNEEPMNLADLARVKREWIGQGGDGMLTLGICSRSVDGANSGTRGTIKIELAKKEWAAARELGLPITMHTSGSGGIKVLNDAGLLGPDVQLVHPLNTTEEERAALAKNGVHYSTSPVGEARRSGEIQFAEMSEAGVPMSLSVDHITTYNANLFESMRILATVTQHRMGNKFKLTSKRLVELGTIDGARDLGLADRTGSLTPGKRADLILIRATDINMSPLGNPYDALVTLAQPGNVDTVVVDGRILRRKNQFTMLDMEKVTAEALETISALKSRAGAG